MSSRQPEPPAARTAGRAVAVAGLAAAGLLLTGCGASTGIHPGSAAVVGSESISMSKIDSTATHYCEAYEPQITQASQRVPMRYLRQYVAANLSQRLLGDQLANEYDVTPTPAYNEQVSKLTTQFADASKDQRDAVIDVEAGGTYLTSVQTAVGEKLLGVSATHESGDKAALQRGVVATQDYLKGKTVALDPVFGIAVEDGQFKSAPDQTSYPLSTLASQGAAAAGGAQPDPDYTSALTPSQVCG